MPSEVTKSQFDRAEHLSPDDAAAPGNKSKTRKEADAKVDTTASADVAVLMGCRPVAPLLLLLLVLLHT
jgi:hypothetical protein